ncbi:PKD-like family lipoprotein [Chitinophaga sp. sic0106]|uniref:PKD-like family lipoprotein n=1 Tax=Chitinophaga sp. sic0106 TaxID=2854785 RepID=UPI001C48EB9F|nr:PKD-like family lipoprotein [Chitinophaga sp. sic0106]MBV7532552.1 hypothetical protein [Chitinophaga sp. sic0106]
MWKYSRPILFLLPLVATVLLLAGCYKDLGNYDYKEINTIELGKFGNNLKVYQYDTLTLELPLSATLDSSVLLEEGRFSYRWIAIAGSAEYQLDTNRVLHNRVNIPTGNYTLLFRMWDLKTGNVYSKRSGANAFVVVSGTYEGWLVFSEVQGRARLDMVNFVSGEAPTYARDILSQSSIIPKNLTGARDICYTFTGPTRNLVPGPGHDSTASSAADAEWIYVATDQGSWKLRNDNLTTKWQWSVHREYIQQDSASFRPAFFGNGKGTGANAAYLYLFDGKGNFYERIGNDYYETAKMINVVQGESKPFKAAPFFCRTQNSASSAFAILFDAEKKRFLKYGAAAGGCISLPTDAATNPLFNFNNVQKDLVWMKTTGYNTLTYAVLRGADGATWLATFNLTNANTQDKYVQLTGTDIDKATLFTVDKIYGTLFYAVGGKVYATHKDYPNESFVVLDKGSEVITYLDQHIFAKAAYYKTEPSHVSMHVMVGSYNEGRGNGTLEGYATTDYVNSHAAFTKYTTYTGFGKIKALSYRER